MVTPGLFYWRLGVKAVFDPTVFRQTANALGKVAAMLTEQTFDGAGDLTQLGKDLATLKQAAEICRRSARQQEARAAQQDDKTPLCLGCKHRTDSLGGLGCALAMDTKEAVTRRSCKRYDAE